MTATLLVTGAGLAFASPAGETSRTSVTFFWALYDGLTDEYHVELQDAFNAALAGLHGSPPIVMPWRRRSTPDAAIHDYPVSWPC